jgi:hypothetical protein
MATTYQFDHNLVFSNDLANLNPLHQHESYMHVYTDGVTGKLTLLMRKGKEQLRQHLTKIEAAKLIEFLQNEGA